VDRLRGSELVVVSAGGGWLGGVPSAHADLCDLKRVGSSGVVRAAV